MLDKPGVTESLARFVVATRWEDIPSDVVHQAKRSLMNFFAVALAGCRTSPVEMALRSLAQFSGGKQATLIGRGSMRSPRPSSTPPAPTFMTSATPICAR